MEELQKLLGDAERLMLDLANLVLRLSDCDDVNVKLVITPGCSPHTSRLA